MKKKVVGFGAVIALIIFLVGGIGIGTGPGDGDSEDQSDPAEKNPQELADQAAPEREAAPPPPCELRLDRRGLWRNDQLIDTKAAIAACEPARHANLVVTGDARQGDYDDLEEALVSAGIRVSTLRPPPAE